jgi:Protein of unknown function (DUF3147)
MVVSLNMSALRETKWYQYAVRFALGGLVTAIAGLMAKKYGPSFGGLFLAFPAIFPASATLIEKQERERKQQKGKSGVQRARNAVAADAVGAAIGGVGLICFGFYAWKMLPQHGVWSTLLCATVIWLAASVLVWYLRKRHVLRHLLETIPLISHRGSRPPALHRHTTYKGSKAIVEKRN